MATPFDFSAPDTNFDLTNLALVKQVIGCTDPTDTSKDSAIQMQISAVSHEWLKWTGHTAGGLETTKSPFLAIQTYDEWYDGNGNEQLFTRTWPIQTVTSVTVNGTDLPLSTDTTFPGYVIATNRKSLLIRSVSSTASYFNATNWRQRGYNRSPVFYPGSQNVHLVTTRGFAAPPADVIRAVTQIVIANLNRAPFEGIGGQSTSVMGRSGSMNFLGWTIPPQCKFVIQAYACTTIS